LPDCNAENTLKVLVSGLKCFMIVDTFLYKKLFTNSVKLV
jgi:hypothetical protein